MVTAMAASTARTPFALHAVLETAGPDAPAAPALRALADDFELPDGVYTAFRTYGKARVLGLDEHFERTQRSMDALRFGWRLDPGRLRAALRASLERWPTSDAKLRIHVLREALDVGGAMARVFLVLTPLIEVPAAFLEQGVVLALAGELRRATPEVKTTDFMRLRQPHPLERQSEYDRLLVDSSGSLLEGTSSNFYGVRGSSVITREDGVLQGITRGILARLAQQQGIGWEWRAVQTDELAALDEAFLSSSTRGVVPVVQVGETRIGNGRPGPITRRMLQALRDAVERLAQPI